MVKTKALKESNQNITYKTIDILDSYTVNGKEEGIRNQQVGIVLDRKYKYTMVCQIADKPYITAKAREKAWKEEFVRQLSLNLLPKAKVIDYEGELSEYHVLLRREVGSFFTCWKLDFGKEGACLEHEGLGFDDGYGDYVRIESVYKKDSIAIDNIEQMDKKSLMDGACYKITLTPYQKRTLREKYFYYG
jgi:hypothetical protein